MANPIPYSQMEGFIDDPQGSPATFDKGAALFAYGDVDGVLRDFIARRLAAPSSNATHPTPARGAVQEKAVANER